MNDQNCISYWHPRVLASGVETPKTRIVALSEDGHVLKTLRRVLEREDIELDDSAHMAGAICHLPGWEEIVTAAAGIGYPCFARTGHTSGKHDWNKTCYVHSPDDLAWHVFALAWTAVYKCGFVGLPFNVFAFRKLLPTSPVFHAFAGRMPICEEYRVFIGPEGVEHVQPYWPPGVFARDIIWDASFLAVLSITREWKRRVSIGEKPSHIDKLWTLASQAYSQFRDTGQSWAFDFISLGGSFVLIDACLAQDAYRWDPEQPGIREVDPEWGWQTDRSKR